MFFSHVHININTEKHTVMFFFFTRVGLAETSPVLFSNLNTSSAEKHGTYGQELKHDDKRVRKSTKKNQNKKQTSAKTIMNFEQRFSRNIHVQSSIDSASHGYVLLVLSFLFYIFAFIDLHQFLHT